MNLRRGILGVFCGAFAGPVLAQSQYLVDITGPDASAAQLVVSPGESFTVFVRLSGPPELSNDTFVLDVVFSVPGLVYQSYAFDGAAYFAGTPQQDFSVPALAELQIGEPHVITAESYTRPPLAASEGVDLHFEALSATGADGSVLTFASGVLIRIDLAVPTGFVFDQVTLQVVPDTIALGFEIIAVVAGPPFQLSIPDVTPPDTGTPPVDPRDPTAEQPPDAASPDTDGDGVADELDMCPGSVTGALVDDRGCALDTGAEPDTPDSGGDPVVDGGQPPGDEPTVSPPHRGPSLCGATGTIGLWGLGMALLGFCRISLRRPAATTRPRQARTL